MILKWENNSIGRIGYSGGSRIRLLRDITKKKLLSRNQKLKQNTDLLHILCFWRDQ